MNLIDAVKNNLINRPIEPLLREFDVAKILNVSVQQVRAMRRMNNGPKVTRIGSRTIRYSPTHVREYLMSFQSNQTSQQAPAAQKAPSAPMLVEDIFK